MLFSKENREPLSGLSCSFEGTVNKYGKSDTHCNYNGNAANIHTVTPQRTV